MTQVRDLMNQQLTEKAYSIAVHLDSLSVERKLAVFEERSKIRIVVRGNRRLRRSYAYSDARHVLRLRCEQHQLNPEVYAAHFSVSRALKRAGQLLAEGEAEHYIDAIVKGADGQLLEAVATFGTQAESLRVTTALENSTGVPASAE